MLRPSFAATTRRRFADSGERRTLTVRFSAGAADFGDAINPILYEHMFVEGCITDLIPLVRGSQASHPTPVRCTVPNHGLPGTRSGGFCPRVAPASCAGRRPGRSHEIRST